MANKYNIDWEYINKKEGGSQTTGYVPSDSSGITVATGFDLKLKDRAFLENMGLSKKLINKLISYMGVSGAEAKALIAERPLILTHSETDEIDQGSHIFYSDQFAKAYEKHSNGKKFTSLSRGEQTVIASVGYQHGYNFTRKDGTTMDFIKQAGAGDWEALINNLNNFGDEYPTRRKDEARYLIDFNKKKNLIPNAKVKFDNEQKRQALTLGDADPNAIITNQFVEPEVKEDLEAEPEEPKVDVLANLRKTEQAMYPTYTEVTDLSDEKNTFYKSLQEENSLLERVTNLITNPFSISQQSGTAASRVSIDGVAGVDIRNIRPESTYKQETNDELRYDSSLGQDEFKWQGIMKEPIKESTYYSMINYTKEYSRSNNDGYKWLGQESFFDSNEWRNFSHGFMNENLLGKMWTAINTKDKILPYDENYNVFLDVDLEPITKWDLDYYADSNSREETLYLIKKRKLDAEMYNKPFWQIFGAMTGGVTDVSSVFLFSKFARPLFMGGKFQRLAKTTGILGAEETAKLAIDNERPLQYGAMILGTNAIFQLVLPAFKGVMTTKQKKDIENFVLRNDLDDEIAHIKNNPKIEIIYTTNTGRWIRPDGVVINAGQRKGSTDILPTGWIQKFATMKSVKDGFEIRINKKLVKEAFKNKAWTKPHVKGVTPLPANQFKTIEELTDFAIAHEKAHTYKLKEIGESHIAYENRINQEALKQYKKNPLLPTNQFKANEYLNNHQKYLEELENEQFMPTWLGKLGESSDWNPIQRMVNKGNLTAIKFAKSILNSPLLTKGNFKGEASLPSISQWMKKDFNNLMMAVDSVGSSYSKYKKSLDKGMKHISRTEFNQRVSKSIVNKNYKDAIPEIREASKQVKDYYKFIGEKIKEANPALNKQEILVSQLEGMYKAGIYERKFYYQDGTFDLIKETKKQFAKRIKNEKEYLDQLRKNPLRENYLNRVINREKIKNNIQAWRTFAITSLKRTMPELTDKELITIAKSYENKLPYKKHKPNEANKTHEDMILEEYFFAPSGMSGNLKGRTLKIDQEEWMNSGYFHSDPVFLMQMYHRSVLPDVYLTTIFGSPNAMGGKWFREKGYQAGIKDIEAEYLSKINKATTDAEKEIIIKEMKASLKDAESIRDLFRGTYGVSDDPSSFYSQGIGMMKMYNAMTSLQGGLASIVDLGRSVFFNGASRSLKATYETFLGDTWKLVYGQAKKEGRAAGELWELQSNARAMNMNNLETMYNTGSKISAGMQKLGNVFFLVNLMTPWNQMIKTHMTGMIQNRVLEEMGNWSKGTISVLERAKLANAGINKTDAEKIWNLYVANGKGVGAKNTGGLKYNRLAFSETWGKGNEDLVTKFNLIIEHDLNIGIITPALNDTPLWMSTQLGGILAQFKKFSMGMTQRMLIRGFQEKDANFFGSIVMMVALGGVIDMMRSKAFDADYSQKDFSKKMMDAFERSGVGGIFMDVGSAANRIIFNDMGGKLGGALGPTGSNIDKLLSIMVNGEDSEQASNVRRLIPFQNIWYLDSLFDQIEYK